MKLYSSCAGSSVHTLSLFSIHNRNRTTAAAVDTALCRIGRSCHVEEDLIRGLVTEDRGSNCREQLRSRALCDMHTH